MTTVREPVEAHWARPRTPSVHLRRSPLARADIQDDLIAAGLAVASIIGVMAHVDVELPDTADAIRPHGLDLVGLALIGLQTVPVAWRRRDPVAVLGVTTGALFLFSLLGYFPSVAAFGFLLALFTVAAYRPRSVSVPACIVSSSVALSIVLVVARPIEPEALISECLVMGAAWFLGDGVRLRRGQVVLLKDRATQLEREHDEWARRAVDEERQVIARELHDVVAHGVSVIVAQAGAAQRVVEDDPLRARGALAAIEHTGREALVEMRRLMGVLRTDAHREAVRSPRPGLDNLEVLVEQVREAGIPTLLRVEGDRPNLSPGLELSAFRIIQEALTNVLKHAGPAAVAVNVRYETSRLELSIADDGAVQRADLDEPVRPGYGLLGMRERVALFGGELRTGPGPHGGFVVRASIPLEGEVR